MSMVRRTSPFGELLSLRLSILKAQEAKPRQIRISGASDGSATRPVEEGKATADASSNGS